jgi:hypothetical protein
MAMAGGPQRVAVHFYTEPAPLAGGRRVRVGGMQAWREPAALYAGSLAWVRHGCQFPFAGTRLLAPDRFAT